MITVDPAKNPSQLQAETTFTHIRKRDGRTVAFEATKITEAICKAGQATGEFSSDIAFSLTRRVLSLCQAMVQGTELSVEQIQDMVEEVLLNSPFKKTARAYILYRDQHARIRSLTEKAQVDLVANYLQKLDWKVQENSNMAFSLQGMNNYISSQISETYWLNEIYSEDVRVAHQHGDLHLHDLGLLSVYCVGWDLQDLLTSGFSGVPGKAESRPAKHFRTALGQIVNFFYTLQGEAAGAQAFSNFDTLLAPFIRNDELTYVEIKQALQEFVFNLNVPTRVGFQTPFTNLTLDLQVPSTLADQAVIIGGKRQSQTYAEFQPEMDLLNQAFLEVLAEGDAKGRVFTFPIPTYNIAPGFDWESPVLEHLWKATARYGIPYFANYVNSDMSPEDSRSMCCRLRLDTRTLQKRGGGLFGASPLTGSIGVVTINMPRLGHVAKTEEEFLGKLDQLLDLAKNSLEVKRKILERLTDKNLYPYTKFYLRDVKQRFDRYWANHFSTIGLVGMNEACMNLMGCDIASSQGAAFAERVLDHMREKLTQFQEETGNFYNLEATPAEGTSYRLARLDQERYSGILSANNSPEGAPFYTNSTQLPVNYTNDIFTVLNLQDSLQSRYTGGTVQHLFLGEAVADPMAVKNLVRKVCATYKLPYFTVTPTFSVCHTHGYLNGEQRVCSECGDETEVYSRVVGYLRPVSQWNNGKRAEFDMRETLKMGA